MAQQLISPRFQLIINDLVAAGYKLFTYDAGTSNKSTTWTDQTEAVPNTNPIILDSQGMADIWLNGAYKVIVATPTAADPPIGGDIVYTVDNVIQFNSIDWSGLTASIADLNSTTTSTLSKSLNYTVTLADRNKTILVDTTAGDVTISLLAAVTALNTFNITIKKIDVSTNKVIIAAAVTELIDGRSVYHLYDYNDFVEIHSDASNFQVTSSQIRGTVRSISSVETLDFDDNTKVINCDASGGGFLVNLPANTKVGRGYRITIKKTDSTSTTITITPAGGELIDGASKLEISNENGAVSLISTGTGWTVFSEFDIDASTPYLRNFISGLLIENNSVTPDTQMDISIGKCRDSTDTQNMGLKAILTKKIDQTWSEGTGNGGYPGGAFPALAPVTWYHFFVISKDDGTTDAGFDTSVVAANLLSTAGSSIWTKFRRIGAVFTDTAASTKTIVPISSLANINGARKFYFTDPQPNAASNNTWITPDHTGAPGLNTLMTFVHIPPDVVTLPIMFVRWTHSGGGVPAGIYFYSTDTAVLTAYAENRSPYGQLGIYEGGGAAVNHGYVTDVHADTSQQMLASSAAVVGMDLYITAWYDLLESA